MLVGTSLPSEIAGPSSRAICAAVSAIASDRLIEDSQFGDIRACLPDGVDRNCDSNTVHGRTDDLIKITGFKIQNEENDEEKD